MTVAAIEHKAIKLVHTKDMDHAEWLENRKRGLGGSDASAVAGVNKYTSPVVLYMEKKGLYTKVVDNDAAYFGNVMEPILKKEFIKRINAEREEQGRPPLKVMACNYLLQHPDYDFMLANIDGEIRCPELGKGILEIKTASEYLKEDWQGDDIPNAYYLQVMHYLAVTGYAFAYVVVLIGGNKYKHYFIERDEETINSLIAIEYDFWHNNFLAGIPPEMDGSDSTKEMLTAMNPNSVNRDDIVLNLPDSLIEHVETVDVVKELIAILEEQKAKHENEIKATMGDTGIAWAGPHKVSWKTDSRGVRSFRLTVNPDNNKKDEIRAKYQRSIDRKRKELEKEKIALEKERLKQEKAAHKAKMDERKAAEKAAKAAVKAAKKAAKDLEKQKELEGQDAAKLGALQLYSKYIDEIINGGNE